LRQVGDRSGADLNSARDRLLEAEHEANHCRLPAAVRAGDRDEFTRFDGQVDVTQNEWAMSVSEGNVLETNG
jgi:hypothetical protein